MSNKNNTPAQKAAWKANQTLGSRFTKFIAPDDYRPEPKEPSKRDIHRARVAEAQPYAPAPLRITPRNPRVPFGRTITQLATVARRLPKLRSHCLHKLLHGKLSDMRAAFYRAKLVACNAADKLLKAEIASRHIGGQPYRDATTWRLRSGAYALRCA